MIISVCLGKLAGCGLMRETEKISDTWNRKWESRMVRKIFIIPSPMEIVDETHIGKK